MGKYSRYPSYKEVDLDYVKTIPDGWKDASLSKLFRIQAGGDVPSKFFSTVKTASHSYPIYTNANDAKAVYGYTSQSNYSRNSITVSGRGEVGFAVYRDHDFDAIIRLLVLSPRVALDCRFFAYFINEVIDFNVQSSAIGQLSTLQISPYKVLIPSREEQTQIANFLDHETAKIDTLIEKQQQLIKLLKEKRQAVISHAVTKGLNPQAPMKDSGVEWLGEVPEHWQVCRLKHIATIQSGIAKGGKDLTGKTLISVPMLRVANVQDGYLKLEDVHSIQIEPHMLERYSLKNGDVLMNEGGDNDKLGRGAIWREQIQNCIHQNHVFVIRTQGIEPEWLDTLTRASYAKFYFFSVAKQSTNLASISATNIKETPILVPSDEEREEILLFLQHQLARFDDLEGKCERQISLLKERRTALISAAVTGKIDVRNWQAPTHQGQALEQTA
ncbi:MULTISPECIES: restriction endonuclease subunit S [Vibrio]|uniref:restriction endonuclease subunit S n=1 Tax=Vibrio TaxID=662 RepID=UPI0004008D30|nr:MULTISPECIES: restriction endonuclease subunit S [Vibrio]MDG2669707.1 restriction endonuclease subunit S [Vibrio parahaemolyticus]TOB33387.1 hypothetical protein CGK08_21105 [Vibrio parahaemolyticus]TRN19280.1 restriction endonuclease subunit S [Vibrio furnissii]